jgi:pimeloyl-ACP methyl ester carboxylesterase
MVLEPRLIDVVTPARPEGVVLVLHGGASRRERMMVSPTQLSVLRMLPIARRVARAGQHRLAVFRLLNSRRGWDAHHTPTRDAHWAMDRIADRIGEVPVCLIGHSLGGRAALLAAGQAHSVVALAPWVYPSDVAPGLHGQRILFVHGTDDRIASPQRSAALARALGEHAEVAYVSVLGGKHAMLRRHAQFDRLAADYALATLLGTHYTDVVGRIEAGERDLRV